MRETISSILESKRKADDKSTSHKPHQTSVTRRERSFDKTNSMEKAGIVNRTKGQIKLYNTAMLGCRSIVSFELLNRIEEGTYGVVFRAKDLKSGEVVALKKLKMENEREGFPITSIREICSLLKSKHENIVNLREVVTGADMDKIYLVMDFVEHDLKDLMSNMSQPFLLGETKTLFIQLMRGMKHLHHNWILHRDIKTSNLLLTNQGILKIADFGLAREYGSPIKPYTPIVVTLWYRAPELLLNATEYSTAIDIWSCGCVLAELLTNSPLFMGKSEIEMINKIFKELGTPNDNLWPGPPAYSELPIVKMTKFHVYPYNRLRNRFGTMLTDLGFNLLNKLLTYDPKKRITAEEALEHPFFQECPQPIPSIYFPTWPAKHEKGSRRKQNKSSPQAPKGGGQSTLRYNQDDESPDGFTMGNSDSNKVIRMINGILEQEVVNVGDESIYVDTQWINSVDNSYSEQFPFYTILGFYIILIFICISMF